MSIIYVISKLGKPLMPTKPSRARKMLRDGKAKCIKKLPFTIKLLYDTTEYTQPMTHGVDTGSSIIGSSVVTEDNKVIYLSEITIRNDVTDKMKQRLIYRNKRRSRKTRYRPARWLHRKNSYKKDRFSPTMISKFNSHFKEIKFVKSILPITNLILETATFDPHALKNPEVLNNKILYQRGPNYGYANTRAYVLARDNYICRNCKGKSKDKKLEVHHIIPQSNNGSDEENNLITLCKTCHDKVHNGTLNLKSKGKFKSQLKHATQMNSIRIQLLRHLKCQETFGFITKVNRQLMNLPKEHIMDAVAIASQGHDVEFKINRIIRKKCVSDGDYQQTKGVRSERKIPTCKIHGFRKFDKVKYLGKEYFIKGRYSTGYCILMNIDGIKQDLKPIPKFSKMERISSRKSWIFQYKLI